MLILDNRFDLRRFDVPSDIRISKVPTKEASNMVAWAQEMNCFRCDIGNIDWLLVLTQQLECRFDGKTRVDKLSKSDSLLVAIYDGIDIKASILPYKERKIDYYLITTINR